MHEFSGKVAVISGASRGIGRAIALKLASLGAQCVLCARDSERLQELANEIETANGQAAAVALDLSRPETPQQLAEFALARFGRLDIVVNNAGATKRGEFLALTEEDWADGFALKFFGAVRLTRSAWPHLKVTSGSVLNIAGSGGRTPGAAFSIGGSVNAALLSLTKSLAETGLADGIQVNALNPGVVRTDRFQKRLQAFATQRNLEPAFAEKSFILEEKIIRVGEPEEIADLAAFVVSPRGRFIHGALIDIDGGATKTI